ncbi:sensor histidine kinase [Rhizohabitans arisaemae]|uniref:sensor histidine kinase n=1 Tax=Rhizohabitans arisaemae TaxID=2720610 RepID=UPI0024B18D9F|nr:sensor histidine kinase [Rhizohabitans arisaemae]
MRKSLRGPRLWLQEHPLLADTLFAAGLTITTVIGLFRMTEPPFPGRAVDVFNVALVVIAAMAVAGRRRHPLGLLCLVALADAVLTALDYNPSLTILAVGILLYTLAVHRGLGKNLVGGVVLITAESVGIMLGEGTSTWGSRLWTVLLAFAVWETGRSVRLRRAYVNELRGRAERLEQAREADTRAARAEERSRIARELHDVVAHHVSVMTVQASAAGRILTVNPDGAREALAAIEEMGRTAMAEMRNIVGVLRTDEEGDAAERTPQPGMYEVPFLVEQMREAGLRTQLWIEGDQRALPPGVDLAAYRMVQESLTNTLRHAGPKARAWVTVRYEPDELTVHVEDDGRGIAASRPEPGKRTGHGLVGIRERVSLYGGMLRIGSRPGGGFEVRARFPLGRTE